MVFQIFSGLYAMYKNYDLINADLLHLDNIIVLSTNKQEHMTYWEYIYNNESYYVPNYGYQFLIADFGRALIPNKLEIQYHIDNKWYSNLLNKYNLSKENENLIDFNCFFNLLREPMYNALKFNNDNQISNVFKLFEKYKINPNVNKERVETFNLDLTPSLKPELMVFLKNKN